jgi:leucyl aminopeptidase (aminopeptidase T)
MALPYTFQTDWRAIAEAIVHRSLRTQPGERVLLGVDPTYFPELTEHVRIALVEAGAIEVAAFLFNSPALARVRHRARRRDDPAWRAREDAAARALFDLADVFLWMPTSWPYNLWQTEEILTTWPGRSIHFHWIMEDPIDPTLFRLDAAAFQALSEQYVRAVLVDPAELAKPQRRLAAALAGAAVCITDDRGTDLRFSVPSGAHFHFGTGEASREFIASHARAGSARDREVELPAGALRTVDVRDPDGTLAVPGQDFGGRYVGTLRVAFRDGRVTGLTSDHHAEYVQALWAQETGDRDRVAEFSIGVNPELVPQPGIAEIPYYGYGAGVVRVSIGDNWESGGTNRSSFHVWLFLTDATVTAGDRTLVDRGRLTLE